MLACALTLADPFSALQAPSDPQALVEEILAEGDFQTELPVDGGGGLPPLPSGLLAFLQLVGWIAAAGVVAWLALLLIRRLRERGDVELAPASVGGDVAPATFTARPIDEAERLAREGRYGEAIRLLLQLAFEALRGRAGVRLEPWLTGREVVREARVSEAIRAALHALVGAVEQALFAGREPGRAEYERCAGEYRALVEHARGEAA